MSEGLQTPEGEPLNIGDVKQQFAQAMTPPVLQDDQPGPPKKAERAPRAPRTSHDKPRTSTSSSSPRSSKVSTPALSDAAQAKQRTESIADTMNLAASGCLMLFAQGKNSTSPAARNSAMAYQADAVVLSGSAEAFGEACASLAAVSPRFARMVDGGGKAGPYFAFSVATFTLGAQIAANHGAIPAGILGSVPRDDVLAQVSGNGNAPDAQ
jgi:hypothetical protein